MIHIKTYQQHDFMVNHDNHTYILLYVSHSELWLKKPIFFNYKIADQLPNQIFMTWYFYEIFHFVADALPF